MIDLCIGTCQIDKKQLLHNMMTFHLALGYDSLSSLSINMRHFMTASLGRMSFSVGPLFTDLISP